MSDLKGKCPTCFQPVSFEHIKSHTKGWKYEWEGLQDRLASLHDSKKRLVAKKNKLEDLLDVQKEKLDEAAAAVRDYQTKVHTLEGVLRDVKNDTASTLPLKRRLRKLKAGKKSVQRYVQALEADLVIHEYCDEAFSREGLPAFLNAQLVPVLNGAAEYYADLFCGKEIQVRFAVQNGEFEPSIINATGGETFASQSKGEKALAGLIASFALREVAPVCNLLILDEPGDGLDPAAARQFAQSLTKLKEKFGTIFVTTFNQEILQELSNEKVITVTKENGISRLS